MVLRPTGWRRRAHKKEPEKRGGVDRLGHQNGRGQQKGLRRTRHRRKGVLFWARIFWESKKCQI